MARLSTHIRHNPSFLGVSKAGTAQGLRLSLICPFNNKPSTCLLSRLEPGTRSIWCCISRSGGNPSGRSLGNTFANSSNKDCTTSGNKLLC
ncbi:hypothetical protein RGQ29_004170 [Quercus rubra]|uniref:Uncharacterized protein n=1 Tax=Quercus rubra TaxID=3512 RepID=A0AAN7EEG6_QUERU|nr:hypothetical protein RGQ29_004170 [Quercus rubra]